MTLLDDKTEKQELLRYEAAHVKVLAEIQHQKALLVKAQQNLQRIQADLIDE